jgi:8-oxo-dGTP diphosphatase
VTARFCADCGGPIEVRREEGRVRETCASCGYVYYHNPLPVAANVVLNTDREVLLVKRAREPNQGMWCLPMGFAEIDESIGEAAARELEEEAGITGEVVTLLHADSYHSAFYGDLLIVSFEVVKTGGVERAGDDAEDVGYFPLDDLPPLAFRSNQQAIDACVGLHRDEWRIQDSFHAVQHGQDVPLLSTPAIRVIEEHSAHIAQAWFDEMLTSPTTLCYRHLDPEEMRDTARTALSRLDAWMRGDAAAEEVSTFYRALGARRAAEGCHLHEVLSSISLLKLHVWRFSRTLGAFETPVDAYQLLELSFLVNSFFDRANYHVTRGFAESGHPGS